MIKIIKSDNRHFSNFGWLQTYWLFSFSNYYDPDNIQFGPLRVFNDDIIAPRTGFPTHPHQEMEIITIVHKGEITHQDSMGNEGVIKAGDVQRMSAGTGLTHSEFNLGAEPVHLYQIWLYPDKAGLPPTYDQNSFKPENWKNKLFAVASGQGHQDAVTFHTDAAIYRAELDSGKMIEYTASDNRKTYLYLTFGKLKLNGTALREKEQARIDLLDQITIEAEAASDFILIDLPSCKDWGYDSETLKGKQA